MKTKKTKVKNTSKMDMLFKALDDLYCSSSKWEETLGNEPLRKEYATVYSALFVRYALYVYHGYELHTMYLFLFEDYAKKAFDDLLKDNIGVPRKKSTRLILEKVTYDVETQTEKNTRLRDETVDEGGKLDAEI